jgi:hypothetical protein
MRTAVLIAIGLWIVTSARADTLVGTRRSIQIPSEHLRVALQALGDIEGLHVVFLSEDVEKWDTSGVSGSLTGAEALGQLLRGTDLTFRFVDPQTVMVLPIDAAQGALVAPSTDPPKQLALVTVTANRPSDGKPQLTGTTRAEYERSAKALRDSRRTALYPQVSTFLTEAAALEPPLIASKLVFPTSGVLPAWGQRVCPQLTGLSRQTGELILTRVWEIAQVTGVRMGDEHCSPNLYIFVTDRPKELVKGLEQKSSYAMFGARGRPYLIDQFIATPRPVKVWYNLSGYSFARVLVIVDRTRLQGVSRGQLADYIAMVGFAEIKPDARLDGEIPTILRLFEGAPQAAPAGLSEWDEAFLRSLNSRKGPWRRGLARTDQLALNMVSLIVP